MPTCGKSRTLSQATRDAIVAKVARRTALPAGAILGRGRTAEVAAARHRAMRALRAMGYSFPEIGRAFGRDHSTVIHAVRGVR